MNKDTNSIALEEKNSAQSNASANQFLGTEKVGKLLRKFAIPCVLSLVIQALYNIVDQIYIGNTASLAQFGNTATGIVYPLTVIALALGLWLGDGAAAIMSLNQGKNDTKDTHRSVGTAITVGLIASVILVAVSFLFKEGILRAFGASDTILPLASQYANFIIIGFPFFILACVLNPVIRADGSPMYAMLSMVIGAVVNIILDPIFLWAFDMGMKGAALATCIAQIITFTLSAVYFLRSKSFRLRLNSFAPKWHLLKEELKLGISSCLTQLAIVIISIVNNNILLQYLPNDESAIGLLAIAFKVYGIVISIAIGIASGGQPIIGYNYGAKKFDRVKKTLTYLLITTTVVGVIAMLLFEFAPVFIIKLFGYSNPSNFGINTFRIYLSFILLTCLTKAISIFFQAVGKPVKATLIALTRDVIALVPLSLIFVAVGGINTFLWSAPVSDVITLVLALAFLIPFIKKLTTKTPQPALASATATAGASTEAPASTQVTAEATTQATASSSSVILRATPEESTAALSGNNSETSSIHPNRIITISREHGAGGREIARRLAEALNVPFYDKELALMAAKETGLSAEFVDSIDSQNESFDSLYIGTVASQIAISAQTKLLNQIAEKGACVILGRAADYVLRDSHPFTIFIYASQDFKKQRIMSNYGDDAKTATEHMAKTDKHRAKFYNDISGKTWGDKKNYDLCIDSSLGIDATLTQILAHLSARL